MAFTGGEAVWCNVRGWPTFPPTAIRKSAWFFPPLNRYQILPPTRLEEGTLKSQGSGSKRFQASKAREGISWRPCKLRSAFVPHGSSAIWAASGRPTSASDVYSTRVYWTGLPGLAFRDDYPQAELRLLYRGAHRRQISDVLCMPCEELLRELVPGRDLP